MKRTARLVALCLAMLCMLGVSVSAATAQERSSATPISENPGSGVTPDDTPLQTDDVESTATINLTLIIRMTDAGVIPDGMVWRITNGSGFLQEGSVPNGTVGSYQQVISIDTGSYQLYVHTDNDEYRYLGTLTIREVDRSVDIKFDRKPGSLTVTVDTNDSGSLPLGSTWSLTNSLNAIVDSGSIDGLADLGTFSTTTVLDYGNYTLNIAAPGYEAFSTPLRINENPELLTANLVSLTPPDPADVTLTLTTSDGLDIPNGTVWSFAGQSGTIGEGQASGLVIDLDPVEYGTYALKVNTPGNTSVYNDPAVVVDGPTESLAVELQIGYSDVTLTIKTWDGSDIPAGTEWALVGTDKAGTFNTATTPDVLLDLGSVRYGQYSLLVQTRGRIFRTFSVVTIKEPTREFEVTITDTRVPEGNFATVDITISTDDGTNLPAGTTWQLTETGPGYPVVQSGRVPVATTSPFNVVLPEPVEWGQYVVFVYSPANVYYRSYVVSIYKEEFSTAVELIHRQGDVTATVSTSDGGDIPAGTTWSITDADDTVIQSGTMDGTSGTALPLTNPIDYGTYTLTMTDPTGAYLPFVQGFIVDEPTVSLDFTLTVVPPVVGTVDLLITTSDGEPVPTGTIITIGGVTMIVTENGVTAADIASGTVVTFVDVPQGEQPILVTNAAPYEDFTGTVDVIAGETIDAAITLVRTQEPEEPEEPATPTPTPTNEVIPPFNPQNPVLPGRTPVPGDDQTGDGTSGGGSGTTGGGVTTLPSTGQQPAGSETTPWVLLGVVTMLALVALGAAHRLRRQ